MRFLIRDPQVLPLYNQVSEACQSRQADESVSKMNDYSLGFRTGRRDFQQKGKQARI
jgi:hypothetical protein